MGTSTGFLDTIILFGALQGFIVSILLFFSRKNKQPNSLLAALIFLLVLASLKLYLSALPSLSSTRAWNIFSAVVPMIIIMPVGPLVFFYTRSSLDAGFTLSKGDRRHFYPVVVDVVPNLVAIVYLAGLQAGIWRHSRSWGNFIDTYNVYSDIPRWISVSLYCWLSARYISASTREKPVAGEGLLKKRRWLRQNIGVFAVFQIIWLIYLGPYIIPRYTEAWLNWVSWYPVYVPLAVLIYWLGIKGYIIGQNGLAEKAAASPALPVTAVEQTMALLKKAMEEDKLYLDAGLNLSALARHTGMPPKLISTVLNQHIDKSFAGFVNEYRVEAFKKKIRQPGMAHLTITGVALECGFNSPASFQRIFKQYTGMVPSKFRDNP